MVTPDLEAIRQALAAAEEDTGRAGYRLMCAAPVWLAQCCDEIERLRAAQTNDTNYLGELAASLVAERDQANRLVGSLTNELRSVQDRLDAALADLDVANKRGDVWREDAAQQADTASAWRACADQLAEALREALSYVPLYQINKWTIGSEALAVYEQLKARDG